MAEERGNQNPEEKVAGEGEGRERVIPAVRHVGPTLESSAADDAAPADAVEAIQASSHRAPISQQVPDRELEIRDPGPEPIKTRLPGDTSSDPHTDVGPDNATVVHKRSENKP